MDNLTGSWNESGGRTTGTLSPSGYRRLRRWRGTILCGAGFRPESPARASPLQGTVHHSRSMSRPLGWMPHRDDVDLQDMDGLTHEDFLQLMEVDREAWSREAILDEELALKLNGKLPKEFLLDRELHISRLWRSPETWKLAYQGPSDVARSSGAKTVARLARDPLKVGSPSRYRQIGLMRRSERSFEAGNHHPTTDLKGDQSRRCRGQ